MSETKDVALITGGRRGIGYGIARCLAQAGYDLAICDICEPAEADEAMDGLKELGADVLYCLADVTDPDARQRMLDAIDEKFGRLNVLVNNAGVAPKVRADMLEATEESYEFVMGINLQAPYFLTQAAARWMIRQRQASDDFRACVVNISSISATVVSTNRGEYCISKAGLSMASQLWAARLGEFDIGVYEIRPGLIYTDMTAPVKGKYDNLLAEGLCVQPRWGMPEDIGKAVAMLARGDLAYSTGQAVTIDGGLTLQRL